MSEENYTQTSLHPEPANTVAICIKTFGLFGNSLIAATLSPSSQLKTKTNYMPCMLAIFDFCVCFNENILHILIWNHWFFVIQRHCLVIVTPGLFCFFGQAMMTWLVGLDRVLIFRLPTKYNFWSLKRYIATAVAVSCLFGAITPVAAWILQYFKEDRIIPVCNLANSTTDDGFKVMQLLMVPLLFFTIITHIWAFKLAGKAIQNEKSLGSKRRLKRIQGSLILIMGAFLCSQVLAVSATIYVSGLQSSSDRINVFFYVTNAVAINISSNMPILAIRSKDYRNEFMKILTCGKFAYNTTTVVSLAPKRNNSQAN